MADKSRTIKNASDEELDELLIRLRKEGEIQNLIAELKRKGSPVYLPYDNPQISTEVPIESLYHYGVLGMHWGRRKGGSALTRRVKPHLDPNNSEDHKKVSTLRQKKVRHLTNSELKTINERLNLEKQYRELSKTETSVGRKLVLDILGKSAKQTATSYTTKYMVAGVASAIGLAKMRK